MQKRDVTWTASAKVVPDLLQSAAFVKPEWKFSRKMVGRASSSSSFFYYVYNPNQYLTFEAVQKFDEKSWIEEDGLSTGWKIPLQKCYMLWYMSLFVGCFKYHLQECLKWWLLYKGFLLINVWGGQAASLKCTFNCNRFLEGHWHHCRRGRCDLYTRWMVAEHLAAQRRETGNIWRFRCTRRVGKEIEYQHTFQYSASK